MHPVENAYPVDSGAACHVGGLSLRFYDSRMEYVISDPDDRFRKNRGKQRRPVILALTCTVSQSLRYFGSAKENSLTQSRPKKTLYMGHRWGWRHYLFFSHRPNPHEPVDPLIKLIAGGAMPHMMTGAHQSKRMSGKFVLAHHLFVSCAVVDLIERGLL